MVGNSIASLEERASDEPYFRPSQLGPDCSTPLSAHLRQRRDQMGRFNLKEPSEYTQLSSEAKQIYLENEPVDPALARAMAVKHVVTHCPVEIAEDTLFLGGENPFFFNLLYPTLIADRYGRQEWRGMDETGKRLTQAGVFWGPCFEGHITPGLEFILPIGTTGLRHKVEYYQRMSAEKDGSDPIKSHYYQAMLISLDSILLFSERHRQAVLDLAKSVTDPAQLQRLVTCAQILERVPQFPAETFREALQSYWIIYSLVTLEMGGCLPGGGIGLGRLDQFLLPYYQQDLKSGLLTKPQALELMEQFLLCFRHIDYYTGHQFFTPGSQASLGGITPDGLDAFNVLSELIMEASLRINMPAPFISIRLYKDAPQRFWEAAANYIGSGLGFPVVNDEVLVPAMLRHERSLEDARDYICASCYEHTIPGREAYNPSCTMVNLPLILEMALNQGRSLMTGELLGAATPPVENIRSFDELIDLFYYQLHTIFSAMVHSVNLADQQHCTLRRYPLMSLFTDDCIEKGMDVCSGGARYNLTGSINIGLPNIVNALAAILHCVFETSSFSMEELLAALRTNFNGYEKIRQKLLAAPKWGNDIPAVDELANQVSARLYNELASQRNARGGRWQLALYSWILNNDMGKKVGASPDGRFAGQNLTRNLNPTLGSDRLGPTAILKSLSHIDFTLAPDGSALDLRFDPAIMQTYENRQAFIGFLKAFVSLGIMEMQISVVDTESLRDAQVHPEKYPHLIVRVAGYSARFIDLPPEEQDELIGRSLQELA